MKTIKEIKIKETIIKKSRFIAILYPIVSVDEVSSIIHRLQEEHKNSTHICYAYIVNGSKKAIDDGEPSGTAGIPMLTVLERYDLNYILAVVIRYFGGIKLGAGGLVRAYSNSVNDAIKEIELVEPIMGIIVNLSAPYNYKKDLEYLISKYEIIKKEFNDKVSYSIKIPITDWNELKHSHSLVNIEYVELDNILI